MNFRDPHDIELLNEMLEFSAVPAGLAGFQGPSGMRLVPALVRNRSLVAEQSWLNWLTAVRSLFRVAAVEGDGAWIASHNFKPAERQAMVDECLLPVRESDGTWMCASLRGDEAWRTKWQNQLGHRVLLVAPTLSELHLLLRCYTGVDYDASTP